MKTPTYTPAERADYDRLKWRGRDTYDELRRGGISHAVAFKWASDTHGLK